jgi:hypothetical protein
LVYIAYLFQLFNYFDRTNESNKQKDAFNNQQQPLYFYTWDTLWYDYFHFLITLLSPSLLFKYYSIVDVNIDIVCCICYINIYVMYVTIKRNFFSLMLNVVTLLVLPVWANNSFILHVLNVYFVQTVGHELDTLKLPTLISSQMTMPLSV